MPDSAAATRFAVTSLRLDTLVRLRWLAVGGQAVAVTMVWGLLGFPLPIIECSALIALSALVNVVQRMRYPPTTRVGAVPAFWLLGYDVLQLAALLYLTGGLENPFSILLLVPLIVSATTLGPRPTIMLGAVIVAAASVLALVHRPLPWASEESFQLSLVYIAGVWTALTLASIFTGIYVFRVAQEARQLASALNEAERVLAREQHLYALDGLAAAAAHELGTPLATIALVSKELEREMPADSPYAEDIALLRSQSLRCREILGRLTSLPDQSNYLLAPLPLSHLVEEVAEPYRAFAVEIVAVQEGGPGPEPIGRRNPAIVQGLVNLVENAIDFALSRVIITTAWTDQRVSITIVDDGPGFAAGIMERIGDPFLTTRPAADQGKRYGETGGLGLGVFIAKTLLERSGGRLELTNQEPPARGARVRVSWPREIMDLTASESSSSGSQGN
jgi:two-component system sensor histidine kinase RegB